MEKLALNISPRIIFKGLLFTCFLTLILCLFFSLCLQYTPLSESMLPKGTSFIFFISMFLGATKTAYTAGNKGIVYSSSVSFAYLLLIILGGIFCLPTLFTFSLFLKKIFLTIICGILGGIIGIGLIPY